MKSNLNLLLVFLLGLFTCQVSFSQDQIGSSMSTNQPQPSEVGRESYIESDSFYPVTLDDQLKQAQETGNNAEVERIIREMNRLTPEKNKFPSDFNATDDKPADIIYQPPFQQDWYTNDVLVYSGAVKFGNPYFRQIDMKMGEDGNMYIAMNRAPVSGTNGRIDVYRSSNGGATWILTQSVTNSTIYFGTVSLLVEKRHATNNDSTRIFVFYTRSTGSNNDNATLNYASWRRNGSAWYTAQIAAPPSGQEYSFASAVSDGAFYSTSTWIGVMCTESNNALTTTNNFRYYRSLNWGSSWTGVTISTAYNDFYPSAEFRPGSSSSNDSVWIAVERRFSASQYLIRVIRTRWSPIASSNTYFVTSGTNVNYTKPALTVKQNRSTDSALFTVTKNGRPLYCPTVNGGASWAVDYTLGNGSNKAFTWCASGTAGNDPFMGMWVSTDGDSIGLRLGGRIGNLGSYVYKRNSHNASTSVSPTCIVYNPSAAVNRAAFSYAGFGPTSIYANQEGLITGIIPSGNQVPETYSMSQNYPNPFNPSTTIKFGIPVSGFAKLIVYDILGREVSVLLNGNINAGNYEATFDASNIPTGIYFYSLTSGDFSSTKKMMLVK